ncbi:MAG: transporter substrate-binding domain-containing protein [Bacteroidetes bacterium]|nr:MAG: transporter substrate-binding domain-containing protein [Bacteroidota bacterium]
MKVTIYAHLLLFVGSFASAAQSGIDSVSALDTLDSGSVIKIAVKHAPPFVFVDETGVHGPIVDFWEHIDRSLGWSSEYIVYSDIPSILKAVESGEVMMSVNPVTVTSDRLDRVDFTQPFYITDTAVMRAKSSPYLNFLSSLFSWKFLSAMLGLGVIILIFGFIVWLIEHRKNHEFRKGYKGIGDGFWWSAVTMTTVGYGDKAPKTPMGRTVAFVWMVAGVVGISSLTAGIASSLTTQNLKDQIHSVRDLRSFKIATIEGTSSDHYLSRFNVPFVRVSSIAEGMEMVVNDEVELFVYDRVLMYNTLVNSPFVDDLEILPNGIRTDYYSFPMSRDHQLLPKVNPLLVERLNSVDWIAIQERYGIE